MMRYGEIGASTVMRAARVHCTHATPQVGPFGSDEDVRFLALAFAGEAGELANVIKKAWRDAKPLDMGKVREELAGAACYLVGMAAGLSIDLDTEMNAQMDAFEARPERRALSESAAKIHGLPSNHLRDAGEG